jgi:hypothetical protein
MEVNSMRNPNRLEPIYDEIHAIHKMYLPDWRIGQLMSNFFGWLMSEKGKDLFYVEEDAMIKYFEEYCLSMKRG